MAYKVRGSPTIVNYYMGAIKHANMTIEFCESKIKQYREKHKSNILAQQINDNTKISTYVSMINKLQNDIIKLEKFIKDEQDSSNR